MKESAAVVQQLEAKPKLAAETQVEALTQIRARSPTQAPGQTATEGRTETHGRAEVLPVGPGDSEGTDAATDLPTAAQSWLSLPVPDGATSGGRWPLGPEDRQEAAPVGMGRPSSSPQGLAMAESRAEVERETSESMRTGYHEVSDLNQQLQLLRQSVRAWRLRGPRPPSLELALAQNQVCPVPPFSPPPRG